MRAVADAAGATGLWRVLAHWQERGLSDDGAPLAALKAIASSATQRRVHAGGSCRCPWQQIGWAVAHSTNAPFPPETSPSEPLVQPMPHQPEGREERQHGKAQINGRLDPLEGPETICGLIAHKEGLRAVGLKALNEDLVCRAAY